MAIFAAFSGVMPHVVTRNNGLGVKALSEALSAPTAQGGKGGRWVLLLAVLSVTLRQKRTTTPTRYIAAARRFAGKVTKSLKYVSRNLSN